MERTRYRIEYAYEFKRMVRKIPKNIQNRIKEAIDKRLTEYPNESGKELSKEWKGHRRLRVGDYRIIYKVLENVVTVFIIEIDHRKDVYDK
jgi:mRNA interferase RelE/StbE